MGRVQGDVTEPCTDRVDVNPSSQKVCCRGVPDGVRADSLGQERRHLLGGCLGMSLYESVDAKACQRLTPAIQE